MSVVSLIDTDKVLSVIPSSILENDEETYGTHRMFDDDDITCWSTDQGSPQSLEFSFEHPLTLSTLTIIFQGGFAALRIAFYVKKVMSNSSDWEFLKFVESDDINEQQSFSVDAANIESFRVEFVKSSDFYGRITIYKLDLFGHV